MSQRLRLHLVGGGIGMIEKKGEKGWKFFDGTQEFSPLAHQKLISPKWREKQGWKTGPIVLQNYSLLCYKLLFVLIRFSLFLHLFVFSFYLRAVVKVTCRFFFYFFSLFFAKWVCIMYAIMAFFFF